MQISKAMKKFLIRLLLFLCMMIVFDRAFGIVIEYMQTHATGGYTKHHKHIAYETTEDVLIFGSSRAIHHYNPSIIADSLKLSCYNCGQDGNGIILFYGWWQLIKQRYSPKIIIYDVTPNFDLLKGEDNHKYLGWLRSEYDNASIKSIFGEIDKTEKYKMISMLYRYNSNFLQDVVDYAHPVFQISADGYLPLKGKLDKMKIKKNKSSEKKDYEIDTVKVSYLEKLILETKTEGVKLYFSISPTWYGMDVESMAALRELCSKHKVPLLDYSNNLLFVKQDVMFRDGNHLNSHGADVFTSQLAEEILNRKEKI